MHIQERRSTSRLPLSSKGYAILNGIDLDLKTHDVSTKGALVEFFAPYSIRKGVKLRVHLNPGFIGMAVVCRVIPGNGRILLALEFDTPLPEAVTIH